MLGCVKLASDTTAITRIVCGINHPDSTENSPSINAPMTERDIPSESGVLSEASFSASIAISRMINCQNSEMA